MSIEFQETAALPKTILRTIKREYLKLQPDEKINLTDAKDLDNTTVEQISLCLKAPFTNCVATRPLSKKCELQNWNHPFKTSAIFRGRGRKGSKIC